MRRRKWGPLALGAELAMGEGAPLGFRQPIPSGEPHPVVCQKSADPKRQQFPNTGGWHDRRSRPCMRRPGGNPCSLAEISLFPNAGNSPARTSSRGRIGDAGLARKPEFGRFPCIYPVDQGFRPRDEFAIDCTHRHSVRGVGDCATKTPGGGGSSREFAGFWGEGVGGTEPEIAGSGPRRHRSPCFSLLPS